MEPLTDDELLIIKEDGERFYQWVRKFVLPFEPSHFKPHASFHQRLMSYACEPLTATAAPRGSLKSSIMAKYRPLYLMLDPTPNTTPILPINGITVSETVSLAREHLVWMKHHLMHNPLIKKQYADPADPNNHVWNEDEIELKNGSVWKALGYESQIRGRHPTDIVVDDLESDKNINSEESVFKLKDWFYRVLMGAMVPETRLTVIGTIIARNSLLSEITAKTEFRGRVWKALIDESGTLSSIWPARWSVAWLLARKASMGTHKFNAEYQNEPLEIGDPIIWQEWIRRHTDEILATITPIRRYITCDPAFTEEKWGNYSAIIIMDEAQDGRLYERLAWRKKVGAPELIKTIISFSNHFSSNCPNTRIGIEEVAAQKSLRQLITEQDPPLGARIESLKPDKDKVRRLIDISRYFEMGIVSLKTESLIDEVLSFPSGDKDRVDALVYGLKMYEQDHPVILSSKSEEIDVLKNLRQDELELYLERAASGVPGHDVPREYQKRYAEAMALQEALSEYLD